MRGSVPLTLVPFIVFNLFAFRLWEGDGGDPWILPLFTLEMPSSARLTITSGDFLIIAALLLLLVEWIKALRSAIPAPGATIGSLALFAAYGLELLFIPAMAHPVFLVLAIIALMEASAEFWIARRRVRLSAP